MMNDRRPPERGMGPKFGSNSGPLNRGAGQGQGPMGRQGNGGGSSSGLFGRENAMTHANPERAYGLFGTKPDTGAGRDNAVSEQARGLYDTVFDETAAENPFADGFDPSGWEDRMAQMQAWRQQMMALRGQRPQMGLGNGNEAAPPVNMNARRWGGY